MYKRQTHDCYSFFLESEEVIPFAEYRQFKTGLNDFPYPASFYLKVRSLRYPKEEVLAYARYFILNLQDQYPQWAFVASLPLTYEGDTLKIEVVNEIQLNALRELKPLLASLLEEVGLALNVETAIDG